MQAYRANRSVLERIVDQPHKRLAQPCRVANDEARAIRADVGVAGESFGISSRLQLSRHLVDQSMQVECDGIGLEASGFEPRKVQHVVERGEQAARRLEQRLGMKL